MTHENISVFGYASGIAGAASGSEKSPSVLNKSPYLNNLGLRLDWQTILQPDSSLSSKLKIVHQLCQLLSLLTANAVLEKKFFTVVGGDHTSAIGTWSGASHAKKSTGPLGLIWIDAHMDSHTPATSDSGNLHGMPLACLLGYGETTLTHLLGPESKLKPENVCLIGVRSFEEKEAALLNRLKVRIFFMDEIKKQGIKAIMQQAIQIVTKNTSAYGISIDIDSIDPVDAPGTGTTEPNGINGEELCQALTLLADDNRLIGAEIAEFDPSRDKNQMTEKLISRLLLAIAMGK